MMGKSKYILIVICILLCIGIISFIYINGKGSEKMNSTPKDNNANDTNNTVVKTFEVTSSAFNNGDFIPDKYTAYGENVSIPLTLKNVSSLGKSIAIIMDDPDAPVAGAFTHWLIWDIPASLKEIPEGIPHDKELSSLGDAAQGKNDFGTTGYKGPQPPSGTHIYKINVYVLDKYLDLSSDTSKTALKNAMTGHIIQSYLLEGKVSHK